MTAFGPAAGWLAPRRRAAVCLTIDDVHPGRSTDLYEAGGDLERGALRHLVRLLERHPQLRATLFVTADWRQTTPVPTRKGLAGMPGLRNLLPLAPRLRKGTMRLDRHPEFVRFIAGLPRTELALHGLHHFRNGPRVPVEFAGRSRSRCRADLGAAIAIFEKAGLRLSPGLCPPGWDAPPTLLDGMADVGLGFVASARDIVTPVSPDARTGMSGLVGVPLLWPSWVPGRPILHIPTNFQATSAVERAFAILEHGGLLSIKAHIVKRTPGWVGLDGLDEEYRDKLDDLFASLDQRYGDTIDWTSMGEIYARCRTAA